MTSAHLLELFLVAQRRLRPGSWRAYMTASAMVALATGGRLLLGRWLDDDPFITFFPAVLLADALCGRGAGLVALALSALCAWVFIMVPAFALAHIPETAVFCILVSLVFPIASVLRASLAKMENLNSTLLQLDADLRSSQTRYHTLADNASDLIMLQDMNSNLQFVSPACRRALGYDPDELIALSAGSRAESLIHPEDRGEVLRVYRTLSSKTPTAKCTLRVRHKDGFYRWAEAVYNWVDGGPDGEPRILTVARDITERKVAEDAAARDRMLLNDAIAAIDDGIAIYDSQERLIAANAAIRRMIGGPADLFEPGLTFEEILDRVRSRYQMGEEVFAEYRSRRVAPFRSADGMPSEQLRPNGEWLQIRFFRSREGGVVSVASDITALKKAAIELDQARTKAEAANIAKSRFLAAASHDLRQPLQTISLLGGILRKVVFDERAVSIIDRLGNSLTAITGILDTLLEINQLEVGIVKPILEDFAIDGLLDRLRIELTLHAEAKGLELHIVPCSMFVRSDPNLLERIVGNLLSNAIKYTQEGKILVGCRRQGSVLRIEVFDTGIGISDDQIEAIFEEFHQVGNPARDRRQGLGLGLSIVRHLSDLLHHPVKARSTLGKGSVFSVEVPVGTRPLATPANERKSARKGEPIRILLVEDDPGVLTSLQMLLELNGHEVATAEDGSHALAYVRQANWEPGVIVSDFNLPGDVNGLELIKLLRREVHKQIPAIVLTGDIRPETRESLNAVAYMVLDKPIDADSLLAAVEESRPSGADRPSPQRSITSHQLPPQGTGEADTCATTTST